MPFKTVSVGVPLIAVLALGSVASGTMGMLGTPMSSAAAARFAPGTRAAFAFLSKQNSNSCSLQPSGVRADPGTMRLQGSCCSPMDWQHYRQQVQGLRTYRAVGMIPADPYDISVSLAQQALASEHTIHLTASQRAVYANAMSETTEKGPCCCQCWRWHTFAGMSKYLIVHKHFGSRQVARVIGLVDGCGGA